MAGTNQLVMNLDPQAVVPSAPCVPETAELDPGACRETSVEAYRTTKRGRDRERIIERMRMLGSTGATRDELSIDLEMPLPTVCGRMSELMAEKVVHETKARRKTRTGSSAVVMVYGPISGAGIDANE